MTQALQPSNEMALQSLIEEQAIDDVTGIGRTIKEGIETGVSTAMDIILKQDQRSLPAGKCVT